MEKSEKFNSCVLHNRPFLENTFLSLKTNSLRFLTMFTGFLCGSTLRICATLAMIDFLVVAFASERGGNEGVNAHCWSTPL